MEHLLNHFSRRQYHRLGKLNSILAAGTIFAAGSSPLLFSTPSPAQLINLLHDSRAFLLHGAQGYLGVDIRDIDNDRAAVLKLKDTRGAEVVTVDHDAPAFKAGLQPGDVIVQMNSQAVDGADQLRRMLHETPPGRIASFVVIRDGQQTSLSAQLVNRHDLERQIRVRPEPEQELPTAGFLTDRSSGSHVFGGDSWSLGSSGTLSVGAVVDPLTTQLASYFGVGEGAGLLVKSVDRKSPASEAGLKAGDVVLKVNDDTMVTRADWQRVLRANEGKQVQVTVLREKKQQQLTMQAGNPKKKGGLEMPPIPGLYSDEPGESQQMVAELRDLREQMLEAQDATRNIDVEAIRAQAKQAMQSMDVDALREQMRQAQQATRDIDFDALRAQAEQAMQSVDVDALREQMQQAQDATKDIDFDALRAEVQKHLEEMKQQFNQAPLQ